MDRLPAAAPAWNERAYQAILTAGLASLGFFLLFATAGVAAAMFIMLAACCFAPLRVWKERPWREPFLALGLLLLACIALRSVIGDGLTGRSVRP
jgi:uncharacterized membrane protein